MVGDVEPLRRQGGPGLALELPVHVGERREVELGVLGDERADVVDADVDGQQAEGAEVAGVGGTTAAASPSTSSSRAACSGPEPPKAHSARSRTSIRGGP